MAGKQNITQSSKKTSSKPSTQHRTMRSAVGKASAKPAVGKVSAKPAVGKASAKPAVGKVSAKPAVGKASDRRVHKRVPINIWVREERGNYYFLFKATDISEGGMFLEKKMDNPSPESQSLFKFTLPKSSRLITVVANTIFSHPSAVTVKPGSGVRFLNLNNQDKKLLLKYINQF